MEGYSQLHTLKHITSISHIETRLAISDLAEEILIGSCNLSRYDPGL